MNHLPPVTIKKGERYYCLRDHKWHEALADINRGTSLTETEAVKLGIEAPFSPPQHLWYNLHETADGYSYATATANEEDKKSSSKSYCYTLSKLGSVNLTREELETAFEKASLQSDKEHEVNKFLLSTLAFYLGF